MLYADSYIDLVALDISDPKNVKEIWRDQEVFPQRNYNGWNGDANKGVVVDWVQSDTTIEQQCTNYSPMFISLMPLRVPFHHHPRVAQPHQPLRELVLPDHWHVSPLVVITCIASRIPRCCCSTFKTPISPLITELSPRSGVQKPCSHMISTCL